jgi:hypothetical protein
LALRPATRGEIDVLDMTFHHDLTAVGDQPSSTVYRIDNAERS